MLPIIAIPNPDDARIVFDALNAHYQSLPTEERHRAIVLLMAAHEEIHRTSDTETGSPS